MKVVNISQSGNQSINFKSCLSKSDLAYKNKLAEGLEKTFNIKITAESLKSVLAPDELKALLKKFKTKDYSFGRIPDIKLPPEEIFKNIINKTFRVNLHTHTNNSDGRMTVEDFLAQSVKYADIVALSNDSENIPPYASAITDHNNIDGVKKVILMIAKNPEKYKNYRFVAGCEFMFYDNEHGLKNPTYEAVGLGFNPFDEELNSQLSKYNPISLIDKIKEFGGIVSYAHPLRFCQKQTFDENFVKYLLSIGINGVESNYQYFFKNTERVIEQQDKIHKIAEENNWYETGGTDTHGKNIFHDKADDIINVLI